jgi:V/A-type H+-transporting ATPase subunit I
MAISKLNLITITSEASMLNEVIFEFVQLKNFHPVAAETFINAVHGLKSLPSEDSSSALLQTLTNIEKEMHVVIKPTSMHELNFDLKAMSETTSSFYDHLKVFDHELQDYRAQIQLLNEVRTQVRHIDRFDISLDDLFSCKYIHARVGRIPTDNLQKLKYYRTRPFVLKTFEVDELFSWCIYFTSSEFEREVDNLFSSLFFSRIHIPDFVHGKPAEAIQTLDKDIRDYERKIKNIENEREKHIKSHLNQLAIIKGELLFIQQMVKAKKYVVGIGDRITINGFTEDWNVPHVQKVFQKYENVTVEVKDAEDDKRIQPPTKLKNKRFFKPFEMFVEMYGLPTYRSIDPTPILGFTYAFLFGVMFGDLGQGLLLSLGAWIMSRFNPKNRLYKIATRLGLFSAFFGVLYGSVFGNETLLDPLYVDVLGLPHKPIEVLSPEFTTTLLLAAIAIGAVLIFGVMLLNMYVQVKNKHWLDVLLSHNGLAGLMIYGFLVGGFAMNLLNGISIFNTLTLSIFVFLPLLAIFFKEPIHRFMHKQSPFPKGFGSFFTESFFELFEVLLSYVTNTMSYLRVGGFVLSHAGMMLVVFTLMNMVGNASLLVAILGNLFVMALEGLIVGIQVLRLEFYEMFSRYYEGNGNAFTSFLIE